MDIQKIVKFIVENWDGLALLGGALFAVFTRWQGKKVRTGDVLQAVLEFGKDVVARAEAKGMTAAAFTKIYLPAEIAAKTSRTLEQAAHVFTIDPMTGKPVVDKAALAVEIAKSGDFKKLAGKFKKRFKKI